MKEAIDNVEYASMLYDFYGELLSDSQREVMAMYHDDDLSLSEIAEELGQSRQAVHYTLKKAEKALSAYEDKLGLIRSYERDQKLADEAFSIIDSLGAEACTSEITGSAGRPKEHKQPDETGQLSEAVKLKELKRLITQLSE